MTDRKSQCMKCHKRTTYDPKRCALIRQHGPAYGCVAKLYGILCADCYQKASRKKGVVFYEPEVFLKDYMGDKSSFAQSGQ